MHLRYLYKCFVDHLSAIIMRLIPLSSQAQIKAEIKFLISKFKSVVVVSDKPHS